ncbi:MAG: alpha-glucosidase [Clostridia bacterium]|nr:alpha-glucosidase [Clostridia bacterium]
MVRRFVFGTPLPTEAVVKTLPLCKEALPYFTLDTTDAGLSFTYDLDADTMIFGLGEAVRGINKRGHLYRSWNSDEPHHSEDRNSLYAAHNFLIFYSQGKPLGVFFDDPGLVTFDLGYTDASKAVITSQSGDVNVYLMEGDSLKAVARAFRQLIGPSYLPPKWAFGYIQSRWGYASAQEVHEITQEHRKRQIPLDGVCMDIDYMIQYKDFTVNEEAFPDFKGFNEALKKEHIRLVPIIDAGVKEQAGYSVYEEGVKEGYFCTQEDGSPFVGAVWPGRSCFPDFLKQEARAWFGQKYHALMDAGVEGFWNDMNEPALFYTPQALDAAWKDALRFSGNDNPGVEDFFYLRGIFNAASGRKEDYESFYHELKGQRVRHDKVHNLYGAYMTRAAHEGMTAYDPHKRFLRFSRSSYIGAHRWGGVWQGDNMSWWSHILLNLKMLPSLNMCGFLYNGADLGGFSCNTTEDLLLRWLQLGVFTPLMRNHAAQGTRDQEIYRFSLWEDMKNILTVRYGLIPYLYSEFMKAALTDEALFRPLAFDYPLDARALRIEDQVMLGGECMIAPVYEQNAQGRYVYLPEDMLMVRFRSHADYDLIPLEKGDHWVELKLNEMPLFIKKGCFIPLAQSAQWAEAVNSRQLTLLGWLTGDAAYALYEDDGYTAQPDLAKSLTTLHIKEGNVQAEGFTLNTEKLMIA